MDPAVTGRYSRGYNGKSLIYFEKWMACCDGDEDVTEAIKGGYVVNQLI
jgi:hypothetical protein